MNYNVIRKGGIFMKVFLTSSPTGPLDNSRNVVGLDYMNNFVSNLKKFWKDDSKCLMIAASPNNYDKNDEMCHFFHNVFITEQFSINSFEILDNRNYSLYKNKIKDYDVIILSGGHVPTQNQFFKEISLKEELIDFDGIVIGISAGSMNSANNVYCQPEKEGEAIDPLFQRWITGLNLTQTNIIPHYQMIKYFTLDGLKLFEHITYKDSYNHPFFCLVDGSYLLIDKEEVIYGEAYLIYNGKIKQICKENQCKSTSEVTFLSE
jgi:dipeptidase E